MSTHTGHTTPSTLTVVPSSTTALIAGRPPIEPQNMAELKDFARIAAATRFFGAETPEQALIIAMAGRDLGFSYMQALRAFYVVKGRPSLSADGMVAVCLSRHDVCEYFRAVDVTETKATWEAKRVGAPAVRYSFSMDDAQRAGLASDMYKKHPKRMLSARAKSYLARDVFPELLMGLITDDEAHEIAEARGPVTPVVFDQPPPPADDEAVIVDALTSQISEATDERTLKRVGAAIANEPLSDAASKGLRAIYAKRLNHLRKHARIAADAAEAAITTTTTIAGDGREPGDDA